MSSFLHYFLLAVIIFTCQAVSPLGHHQLAERKIFLLGGATSDSTNSIYDALRESTGKIRPSIAVVISAAPSLADGLDAYYVPDSTKSYEQLFTDYGFIPSVVRLAMDNYAVARTSDTALGRENINLIANADVVFFNGGDQSRHSRSWLNDDGTDAEIMTVLRSRFLSGSVVIAGTSAGAAVQANPTYGEGISYGYFKYNADLKPAKIGETFRDDREGSGSERYDINGGYMTGFGFLENALIDTHFDARGRFVRLAAVMKNVNTYFGFGVGEDTALYLRNATGIVYGNGGVWILDSTDAKYPNGTEFLADKIRVHYLTEGDSVDFGYEEQALIIKSSKPLITTTTGTAAESKTIFAKDEGIKCMTSLVSSNSFFTNGYSKEKNPNCRVIFYKGEGSDVTKGYRSATGDQFTIVNLYMDIESI
jgi:cyanophycinase